MAQWRKVIVSGSSAVLNEISASGAVVPISDNGSDLGSSTLEWKDLYIDGTANLDTVSAGDITGTTIDATTDYTIDGLVLTADTITNDAALSVVSTGLTLNASLDIALSADGGNVTMDDGTTTIFDFDVDGTSLTIHDDQDTGDTAVITMAQHGALSIVTTDDDAAAANIQITADGTAELAGTTVTLDSGANVVLSPAGGSHVKIDDVIQVDSGVVTGATSITSTNFVGILGATGAAAITGTTIDATTDFTIDGLVISADDITNDNGLEIQTAGGDITLDPGGNNVLPGSDSADSLGQSGTAWAKLWVDDIDLAGQGSISMGGTAGRIDLDADDDTSIRSAADDVITFEAGGVDILQINASKISGSSISTGSFGHLIGDGSGLTGVAQDIDLLDAYGAQTLHQTQDLFHLSDNGTEKSITFSNLQDSVFADISGDVAIAGGGAATIQATSVEGSMLNDNVISGQGEMTGDVVDADELMVSDAGVLKRVDFSVFRDAVFNDVSGDATMVDGGALSLAANTVDSSELVNGSVDDGHLSDGVATGLAGAGMTATSGVMNVIGTAGAVSVGADAVTLVAANTTLTSILNTSLSKIGTATAEEYIKFDTSNEVNTHIGNSEILSVTAAGVDVTGAVTISGNLDVNGTVTTIDSANTYVADKFMIIASGSATDTDGGIIVQSAAGAGYALGYDSGVDRWVLDADLAHNATNIGPDAYVGVVQFGTTNPDTQTPAPTYGGTTNGIGTIYIDTNASHGDQIWIYA